ncbi:MAG: VWA-like domain-containing protein [Pseudomonadota bacterium]
MTAAPSREHRGTRALQALIERAPATGALGLWMSHRDDASAPEGIKAPLAVDAASVRYFPDFEMLSREAQMGWVAHAILHVAFRHSARREALRSSLGNLDDALFNVCADALINSTLSHLEWLQLPDGAFGVDTLLLRAMGEQTTADAALMRYDVESLYRLIDDRRPVSSAGRDRGQSGQQGDGEGEDGRATVEYERHGGQADGPKSAAARSLESASPRDLLPGGEDASPEDAAENTRAWRERLVRGHASDGPFSLLGTIGADVPASRVPWPEVLRRYTGRALLPEPELSWSRPSRSWLANRGRTPSGQRMPLEPGTLGSRQSPRLVVVVDVSGSIDNALLARFFGHLQAIVRRTRTQAVLVIGDDRVRHVIESEPGKIDVPPSVSGGGGTDFRPLLAESMKHRPDLIIVLTDLDGPAGSAPRCPVLWAVTGDDEPTVPFGRSVKVD